MTKLTEDMIIARTKTSDLSAVKKLNCWGSDLDDISLVRRLSNVEVLSLSLNKIKSLADFQHCRNLVELYVRRNEIRDLSELCYLQDLPRLKRLLLAENPCVETAGTPTAYRYTVLRALPNLEVLDNTQVSQDEVDQAFKQGLILEFPSVKERTSPETVYYREESPPAPTTQAARRGSTHYDYDDETLFHRSGNAVSHSPPADYYFQNQNGGDRSRSRTPEPSAVQATQLTNNTNNGPVISSNSNGNQSQSQAHILPGKSAAPAASSTGGSGSSPQWEDRDSSPTNNNGEVPSTARRASHSPDYFQHRGSNEREITNGSGSSGYIQQRRASTDYAEIGYDESSAQNIQNHRNNMPNLVLSQRSNSQQHLRNKPRTKSSNLLSAVLCLIPELDWQSLEVVELAVRRRMDELISD